VGDGERRLAGLGQVPAVPSSAGLEDIPVLSPGPPTPPRAAPPEAQPGFGAGPRGWAQHWRWAGCWQCPRPAL